MITPRHAHQHAALPPPPGTMIIIAAKRVTTRKKSRSNRSQHGAEKEREALLGAPASYTFISGSGRTQIKTRDAVDHG